MKEKKPIFTKPVVWLSVILMLLNAAFWGIASYAPKASAKSTAVSSTPAKTPKPKSSEANRRTAKASEADTISINIKVGKKTFAATFYDNETTQAFIKKMPISLPMSDLNQNEKFYRLENLLPTTNTIKPSKIRAGEIMCWSSDTIVLFYESFDNSYGGYVKLGYIEDITGLTKALGKGDVTVSFEKK